MKDIIHPKRKSSFNLTTKYNLHIMKNFIKVALVILFAPQLVLAQCKDRKIEKACKPMMKPFSVDGYGSNALPFDSLAKTVHVDFTAFPGEKYKLVFCASGFQEEVKIEIYDKSDRIKTRTKVFEKVVGGTEQNAMFEPKKSGNYYIEYKVPAVDKAAAKNECIVLLIGYME